MKYIVGNEACERFSFYGMRSILTVFLVDHLLRAAPAAERPVPGQGDLPPVRDGGVLLPPARRVPGRTLLGQYRTIFWLSLVYCAGHACLAMFDDAPVGFYAGLVLIAIGAGGIKRARSFARREAAPSAGGPRLVARSRAS